MHLTDSVIVSMRVGDVIAPDGTIGAQADNAVGVNVGSDAALGLALQFVLAGCCADGHPNAVFSAAANTDR